MPVSGHAEGIAHAPSSIMFCSHQKYMRCCLFAGGEEIDSQKRDSFLVRWDIIAAILAVFFVQRAKLSPSFVLLFVSSI